MPKTTLFECLRDAYVNGGDRSATKAFYRGLNATMLRDFFFCPLFFGQYQLWKRHLNIDDEHQPKNQKYLKAFLAGSVSLMTAWTIIYPIDLIKTQIQGINTTMLTRIENEGVRGKDQTRSIVWNVKERYRLYGVRGFYSGLSVTLLRTIPAGGCSFLAYELMKEQLNPQGIRCKNHE